MKKKTNLFKTKIFLSLILALTMLVGVMTSSVTYARNVDGSVKAVNILGYQYVNQTTINVFFDKGLYNVNQGQFKIETTGGTPVTISNMALGSGIGWSNPQAPGGATIVLTTATALSANTTYKLTVSSTVAMGNSYHLTLGNYWLHNDISFNFKTPNSDGVTYSGSPTLKFIPTWNGSGLSGNIAAISDMPIDVNLAQVKLQKSSTETGTYTDVLIDSTLDTIGVTDAEAYSAQLNDARTCIFLPETLRGGTPSYNLKSENYWYKLSIPTISNYTNSSYTTSASSNSFKTGKDTVASVGNITPTVTGHTSSSVSLSWSDVTGNDTGNTPDHYVVYYSTNPYFNFLKSTDTVIHSGTTNSCTVTGLSSVQTYYFRIVPVDINGNEGGFSPHASQATN
jgi:hypothetical protein